MEADRFLARVAEALRTARLPEAPDAGGDLPAPEAADLLALFRTRAQQAGAVVHGPVGRHGVEKAVAGIAAGHDARTFTAWDDLPVPGVVDTLEEAGLSRIPGEGLGRLRHVDLGITGAAAALAESGSVALVHGPGRPRLASLLPEVHVALVEARSVHAGLAHWAAADPEAVAVSANLVVVTGPSRSADIELRLNLGVHGPRHVHVVLID